MTDERELERHNRILNQIESAQSKEELPKVSFATINSYLANNVYFNNEKISQKLFQRVVNAIVKCGSLDDAKVKRTFIEVVLENYPNVSEEEIIEKYISIMKSKRIDYILSEITQKNLKLDKIIKLDNLEFHKEMIKVIKSSYEIKDLPKVGLSELNKKILKCVNDNDFISSIKTSEIKDLTQAFLEHKPYKEIENIVDQIVSKYSVKDKTLMKEQIIASLRMDETIDYTAFEIALKEIRKLEIYKLNHEEIMDNIKEAHRISQLPPNLTVSTITNYLNGNTTIYRNDDRVTSDDLKNLTELLMQGHKWEDEVIIEEVKRIALEKYPEKEDAFDLLYNKLSVLPKTYYLVEEIKYAQERQTEFIGRGSSNVNVYFIPNNKSPIDGGRFYNCYINRVGNLDLEQILPLDLDTIVPPEMDIDSIEWYVQEYVDPTFKTAGGIILNKDETIGNVSIFKPNDGKVGISLEEKEKMDEIDNLDIQIEEKRKTLEVLNDEIESKEQQSQDIESKCKQILVDYEKKALILQKELLENIDSLKSELGIEQSRQKIKEKNDIK